MIENQDTAPKRGVQYETLPDGKILRTAPGGSPEEQATIVDGVLTYTSPEGKSRAPAIMKHLKAIGVEVKETRDAFSVEPPQPVGAVPADAVTGTIPPPPPLDKMAGDKTPAYVEWLKTYKPEEFRRRFGVMGEGHVLERKAVINAKGRKEVIETRKPALLASRNTVATQRPRE